MKWSREPIKTPGWYWFKTKYITDVRQVAATDGKFMIISGSYDPLLVEDFMGEWAGPIPEPKDKSNSTKNKEDIFKRILRRIHLSDITITKIAIKMTDDDYGFAGEHFECTFKSHSSGQTHNCLVSKAAFKHELEKENENDVIFL